MAKVFIEETTLTAIGDAIRGKTGKTELIDPANMHSEIASIEAGGGGGAEVPDIVITGAADYACSGAVASAFMTAFPGKVSARDITSATSMFMNSPLEVINMDIPYKNAGSYKDLCKGAANLKEFNGVISFPTGQTSNPNSSGVFDGCTMLEKPPVMLNIRTMDVSALFRGCKRLRNIQDDFFSTWTWGTYNTSWYTLAYNFRYCHSLRKIPTSFFETFPSGEDTYKHTSATASITAYFAADCTTLDELVGMPVTGTYTSNALVSTVSGCHRLSRFTFKLDNGVPFTPKWKSQSLTLSGVGYAESTLNVCDWNSGITRDKEVKDDATYQALKNDPDWFTCDLAYSRYNHDSAVETINSLPDTSAYLATAGGTNTITFKGEAGSKTDGGAINTLTEAEIAVAAAKGWTVTLV